MIVAVDDEPEILRLLEMALDEEGFAVVSVSRSPQAATVIREHRPAAVLLDLMMPELGGLDLLDQVRAFSAVPVIIVTARGSNRDIVEGLDRGADDYLAKPFNLGELAARVRAVLRRSRVDEGEITTSATQIGNLTIDFIQRTVTFGDQVVHLTPNEWRLFEQFARRPGHVIGHRELLARAWGPDFTHDIDYLRVWLSRLRRKLTEAGADAELIRTVAGLGYAFALEEI